MAQGLNDGKGSISVLAKNEIGAVSAALSSGHVKDYAELSAFIGLGSTISKGGASSGITFKQMDRLVNETQGPEGEFLKSIGVAGEKDDYTKLAKLKEHVDAQRQAAPDPAQFDPKAYLMEKGFHEQGEVDRRSGIWPISPFSSSESTSRRFKPKTPTRSVWPTRSFCRA